MFSIDLEDFAQLVCWSVAGTIPDVTRDLDRQMDTVLSLLEEHKLRGTFFVLGMVASRRPDIVRRVHAAGHEIATHGTNHVQAFRQTRAEFKADVGDSVKLLSDLTGRPVLGYRAPQFSIVRANLWALDLLAELGLQYDSSIFPMRLPRYGIDGFDPLPQVYQLAGGGRIVEIPLSILQRAGRRLPIAGGGYLRLMPQFVLRRAVKAMGRAGQTFTLYLHPYEFDPQPLDVGRTLSSEHMPALRRALLNAKWNLRRRSIIAKVHWMCRNMRFTTYTHLAQHVLATQQPRPLIGGVTSDT